MLHVLVLWWVIFFVLIGGKYAESDDEVDVLCSEINNCFTQMKMLRREFTKLREEVMAAKCLMDSVRGW